MRFHTVAWVCLAVCLVPPGMAAAASPDLAPFVQALRNVQPEGKGHLAATSAWAELTEQAGVGDLPAILAGMDGAGPLAANWLRAAVDAIAERHLHANGTLPTQGLERFLAQEKHNPRARRLAFEWIARVDPAAPDRLIPGMLDDPSLELRRDAVATMADDEHLEITRQEVRIAPCATTSNRAHRLQRPSYLGKLKEFAAGE